MQGSSRLLNWIEGVLGPGTAIEAMALEAKHRIVGTTVSLVTQKAAWDPSGQRIASLWQKGVIKGG